MQMSLPIHNQLRRLRKSAQLSIADMEHLLGMAGNNSLTRYETGKWSWSIDMLLTYHILFEIPFQQMLQEEIENHHSIVVQRIEDYLPKIKKPHRKRHLIDTLYRLTQPRLL